MTTLEKRLAALMATNRFAASGGSRLPALQAPRETRPCASCGIDTDARHLQPLPAGGEICTSCYDLLGAADYDREAYARLMAAVFQQAAAEERRSAAWDKWAHRLTVLGVGVIGYLIAVLLWRNLTGGERP